MGKCQIDHRVKSMPFALHISFHGMKTHQINITLIEMGLEKLHIMFVVIEFDLYLKFIYHSLILKCFAFLSLSLKIFNYQSWKESASFSKERS